MDWEVWIRELVVILEEGDEVDLGRWVDGFVSEVEDDDEYVPTHAAEKILSLLQDRAHFPLLRRIGELVGRRNKEVRLQRRLAQSLIETGDVTRAIVNLLEVKEKLEGLEEPTAPDQVLQYKNDKKEYPEIVGLLGRAHKKLYVDASPAPRAPRTEDYESSRAYYMKAYQDPGGGVWHGINLIALEAFHESVIKKQPFTENDEIRRHAGSILKTVDENSNDPWDLATRAEALLAMGRNKDARGALQRYLEHKDTTVFMVQSTRRQFRELWRLEPGERPGNKMLPMLDAAYAEKGGSLEIERSIGSPDELEAILGDTQFKPLAFLRKALMRAGAVARVGRKPQYPEMSTGTGFLVDGSGIHAKLPNRPLLLTNCHVSTSNDEVREKLPTRDVLRVEETKVVFLEVGKGEPQASRVVREWFTSPPWELDATLLELDQSPVGVDPLFIAEEEVVPKERVNILGHPDGSEMAVSLQDNRVLKLDDHRLHYRTPTRPGSSGSPVFNGRWEVVALHHAGLASTNEGILMDHIVQAIRKKLDAE